MTLKLVLVLGMLLGVAACAASPFSSSQARFYASDSDNIAHEINSEQCGSSTTCP
jgi:ABC-type glycerol-3-phosphate transport system substrate-binding protein